MPNPVRRLTTFQLAASIRNTLAIMDKAEKHAKEHGFDTATLLQARLFPNMYTLLQQLQYVCYIAVDLAKHFSSEPAPRVGYDEENWEQLKASLESTAKYLKAIKDSDIDKNIGGQVPAFFDEAVKMNAVDYAAAVSLPDFYFHMSIAYAILRHNGVPLAKSDFLGKAG